MDVSIKIFMFKTGTDLQHADSYRPLYCCLGAERTTYKQQQRAYNVKALFLGYIQ